MLRDKYKTDCPSCNNAIEIAICDMVDLETDIEDEKDNSYDAGIEEGKDQGFENGYSEAQDELSRDTAEARRETDLRLSLYRAIYSGDIEAAEDAMNLMAMVDIDRELIWQAKGMDRG